MARFFGFERLHRLLLNSLLGGGSVLMLCRAGAHSAGTCTAAYAIMAYRLDRFEAVGQVSIHRPCTQVTGANFMLLTALHKEL